MQLVISGGQEGGGDNVQRTAVVAVVEVEEVRGGVQ